MAAAGAGDRARQRRLRHPSRDRELEQPRHLSHLIGDQALEQLLAACELGDRRDRLLLVAAGLAPVGDLLAVERGGRRLAGAGV
jgi:hypothetical protein